MLTSLGRGLYTFKEAAALTGLPVSRVREWFRGQSSDASVNGRDSITFLDLIDVYLAGHLREHGVSPRTIRAIYRRMQNDLDAQHPFCRQELRSDGKPLFLGSVDDTGKEKLAVVLTRQGVFSQVLLPFLKQIDYDKATFLAKRWRIADGIVIDPAICFGAPVVEAVGIPTSILAAAYHASAKSAGNVARWYNVSPKNVLAAVKFEGQLAA